MTEQTIASLGLKVESAEVVQGTKRLDDLAQAANRAEQATENLARGSESAAEAVGKSANSLGAATRVITGNSRIGGAVNILEGLGVTPEAVVGISAAAGAVLLLGKAYLQGATESETFARALAVSGNQVGKTVGQLALMAERLSDIKGTQHEATAALAEFVANGRVAGDNLERFTRIGQDIERNLGVPLKEVAKQFADLADKPTKSAAKLNETISFLTPAIYDQIRAQEKAGQVSDAAATAQKALADAYERQNRAFEESVPGIVRGWHAIEGAAAKAWDAILGVGRQDSPEQKLKFVQDQLAKGQGERFSVFGANGDDELKAQEASLKAVVAARKAEADAIAKSSAATADYIHKQEEADKKARASAELAKQVAHARLALDVGTIRSSFANVEGEIANLDKVLEAQRAANIVNDQKYFETKRGLIQREINLEVQALEVENDRLKKQGGNAAEQLQLQNRIAENEAKILQLRARGATELQVLSIQEKKANEQIAESYEEARLAAERYVETLEKRFRIESEGVGIGEQARQRLRDRADLEDRFEQRKQGLDADLRRRDITKEQYDAYLKIEEDALKKSEAAFDEHYKILDEKQGDWLNGVREAVANFIDQSKNVAGQIDQALSKAFDNALDSVVRFALTGKGSFKDLANSIIADLLRIQLRIIASQALQQIFGGINGAIGGGVNTNPGAPNTGVVGPRAAGGPIDAGQTYLVGEEGPELVVPRMNANVIPNHALGGITINNYNTFGANSNAAQIESVLDQRDNRIKADIYNSIKRGRWGRVQ